MTDKPTSTRAPDPDRLLAAALRLAAAGRPVFPCVPDAKRPLTAHGLLDATTDEKKIHRWWKRWPTANLAMVTGAGSHDVLDVDVRPGGSGFPSFNRLVREGLVEGHSHIVMTPSGGLHAYFTGTTQHSARLPDQHLDFKAAGGYVLTPPSVVGGRAYELARRTSGPHTTLDWPAVRAFLGGPALLHAPSRGATQAHGIEPLAAWVGRLPEGRRNGGTFWAACRAVEQGITDLRPIVEAAVIAGLSPNEAARTVSSAIRRTKPLPLSQPHPRSAVSTSTRLRPGR